MSRKRSRTASTSLEVEIFSSENEAKEPIFEAPDQNPKKRSRKQTNQMNMEEQVKHKELLVGNGVKLKNIPKIAKEIKKYPANSYHYYLESFHNVLFGFGGSNKNRRQNILNFSGFPESIKREAKFKVLTSNTKYSHNQSFLIKTFLEMLCLDKKGKKEDLINRLLDFLYDPKP